MADDRAAAIQTAQDLVAEMRALRQDLAVVSGQIAQLLAGGGGNGGPLVSEKLQNAFGDILGKMMDEPKPAPRRRARRY